MTLIEVITAAGIIALVSLVVISAFSTFLNTQRLAFENKVDAEAVEAQIATGEEPFESLPGDLELNGYSLPGDIETYTEGRRSYSVLEGVDPVIIPTPTLYFGDGARVYAGEGQTYDTVPAGGTMTYRVTTGGRYLLETWGARGGKSGGTRTGNTYQEGFTGAYARSCVTLSEGVELKLLAGGMGGNGSGGGGSFITTSSFSPLCIAGGGGGQGGPVVTASNKNIPHANNYGQASTNGGSTNSNGGGTGGQGGRDGIDNGPASGGGGLESAGSNGPYGPTGGEAFIDGGEGGKGRTLTSGHTPCPIDNGGLGGGGGGVVNNYEGYFRGGGGGGYSGGQGGTYSSTGGVQNAGGGGGGSFAKSDVVGVNSQTIAGNASMPDPLDRHYTVNFETGQINGLQMVGNARGGFIRITYLGS
ncbi:MAG: hypothetical protein LBO07_02775 [Coriobacteriales bacterium]|jgi:hypothetical protein|nr:hypothetical protein [Coriobacteriales bacterium]